MSKMYRESEFLSKLLDEYYYLLNKQYELESLVKKKKEELSRFYAHCSAELYRIQKRKEALKENMDWSEDKDGRNKFFN